MAWYDNKPGGVGANIDFENKIPTNKWSINTGTAPRTMLPSGVPMNPLGARYYTPPVDMQKISVEVPGRFGAMLPSHGPQDRLPIPVAAAPGVTPALATAPAPTPISQGSFSISGVPGATATIGADGQIQRSAGWNTATRPVNGVGGMLNVMTPEQDQAISADPNFQSAGGLNSINNPGAFTPQSDFEQWKAGVPGSNRMDPGALLEHYNKVVVPNIISQQQVANQGAYQTGMLSQEGGYKTGMLGIEGRKIGLEEELAPSKKEGVLAEAEYHRGMGAAYAGTKKSPEERNKELLADTYTKIRKGLDNDLTLMKTPPGQKDAMAETSARKILGMAASGRPATSIAPAGTKVPKKSGGFYTSDGKGGWV